MSNTTEIDKKALAFHDIICEMLRGHHVNKLTHDELRDYIYQCGVALHNIPINIANTSPLTKDQIRRINILDPSYTNKDCGIWAKRLLKSFNQDISTLE